VAKNGAICPIFEGDTPNIGANIGAITGILLKQIRSTVMIFKIMIDTIEKYETIQ
jgi:hypothetical protein